MAAIIHAGDDIKVLDHDSGRDITAATMVQIIFEEEKRRPQLPVTSLRQIIQTGRMP